MSLFSKRKKLIIGGCSFTANYARQNKLPEFPLWGEILAEKLDMDLINLGKCGYGNQAIYTTLIEKTLDQKNIGLVVALWSEFQRVSFYGNHGEDKNYWECFLPERVVLDANWHDWFYQQRNRGRAAALGGNAFKKNPKKESISYKISIVLQAHRTISHAVIESVNYFYSFQSICENLNVPYLQAQGCNPITAPGRHRSPHKNIQYVFSDTIISRPHDMTKNFIGWPIAKNIGGFSMSDILNKYDPERINLRISPEDTHPNAEGHMLIAEMFYDEYEKNNG